jgi:hypothetical protein
MKIRNGRLVSDSGELISDPNIKYKSTTYTDNHTVTLAQTGETLVMNSSNNKTFTLPSVSASDIGTRYTFANENTGRVTIQTADSDVISDSAGGGTIYSDTNGPAAQITIELVSATEWAIIGADGTWTTT